MDYSGKQIHPDVLDFYRPTHANGNRFSNSGHNCHAHDQHPPVSQRYSQPVSHLPLHVKTNSGHRVSVTGTSNVSHGGHPQLVRVYQQVRPHTAGQPHSSRIPVQSEAYRHNVQACHSTASGVSTGTSGYASLSSICKGGHKSSASTSLRAAELVNLLRGKFAMLPGGRTKNGGPILCFPANSHSDTLRLEDLYCLVRYLTYLPEENTKKLGFAVVIDMRSGTTWNSVKPILKVIEECIGENISTAYLIKPHKMFQKQKAQLGAGKFSFNIQMVSVEQLFMEIDPSQLTVDLEGTLPYHHDEWIQIRCCLEEFFMFAHDMSDKFSQLYCFLDQQPNPESVDESKRALEDHRSVRLKVMQAPVPALEAEADRLTAWLRFGISVAAASTGASGGVPSTATAAAATGSQSGSLLSSVGGSSGGAAASYVPSSWVCMNPDFQQLVIQVRQTVTQLYEFRAHLQQKWETGRTRLEQIYQFRLFKDDASRMTDWLDQQRMLFLTEHADIADNVSQADDLYIQHHQFLQKCGGLREQVSRLTGIARMLADTGHFAGQQMLKQACELEHKRKSFSTALEERTRALQLSKIFHTHAEAFLNNCTSWETGFRHVTGTNVGDLNQALQLIQDRWQDIQRSYEEACGDGRTLVDLLSAPVTGGSHTSLAAAIDYSQGRKHCADLVHELWDWYKRLDRAFTSRKSRLTSRLALLMFKEDVKQVLAWLTDHGEPFLTRQTAIGKSSQRAEQLYNSHMHFEQVAATTMTNTDKLISAADELALQAENPTEVRQEVRMLQQRITAFTNAVDARRETLDLACGFYGHTREVLNWFHGVSETYNPDEHFPPSIEGMEDELTAFHRDRANLEAAVERVTSEGEALISRIHDSEEAPHLRSILTQVTSERTTVGRQLTERQVRLDLCMQLRLFEADVHASLEALRRGVPAIAATAASSSSTASDTASSVTSGIASAATTTPSPSVVLAPPLDLLWVTDPRNAPSMAALEEVNASCTAVLPTAEEVLNKGGDLIRAFESVGVNFPAGGPGSSDSGVGDSSETAVERVHRLISELGDIVANVDEVNERVSNELDWRRLQSQSRQPKMRSTPKRSLGTSNFGSSLFIALSAEPLEGDCKMEENNAFAPTLPYQVLKWISQCEAILQQTALIPSGLGETESMQTEHDRFQSALNGAHPGAVQCAARASYLLQSVSVEHPRRADFQTVAESIATRWQKLVCTAEEKQKFLIAATNWYKTSEQVISVLRSLEKSYRRVEDFCQSEKALSSGNVEAYLNDLLNKHGEQKESFLRACILARRTSDLFMKYLHRQAPTTKGRIKVEEHVRSDMADLMTKEQAVLEAWAAQRRSFEECVKFVSVEIDMNELARRIFQSLGMKADDPGTITIAALPSLPPQSPLCSSVKRACQTLKVLAEAGGVHGERIGRLLQRFNACLAPCEPPKSAAVGDATVAAKMRAIGAAGANRTSVSSTGSGGGGASSIGAGSDASNDIATMGRLTEEQRKLLTRRQNILRELVTTERAYVVALKTCLETFRIGTMNPPVDIPIPSNIAGRESVVFGNLEDIYDFHEKFFEPEIRKYAGGGDFLPEDVGHCFVAFGDRLAGLYVDYCVNKEDSMAILVGDNENFFGRLQFHYELAEPLQSFLIKPVQRITKYQLLLRELRDCCDKSSAGELSEGMDVMMAVPKKANEAIHLRMLQGFPEDLPMSWLGDVVLQDQFTVWEPKQLIKKGRERRAFLFDICLVLAKECPVSPGEGKMKYQFKSRFLLADLNITEHIEGDQCKFALWSGRVPPVSDYRLVLKALTLDVKQAWVRAIRETMRERMFSVQSLHHEGAAGAGSNKFAGDSISALDAYYIRENYQAQAPYEISVSAHQIVQLILRTATPDAGHLGETTPSPAADSETHSLANSATTTASLPWALVRVVTANSSSNPSSPNAASFDEGYVPSRLLGAPVYPRAASVSTTGGSTSGGRRSMRRWLPSSSVGASAKDRRQILPSAMAKRNSKADLPTIERSRAAVQHIEPPPSSAVVATNGNAGVGQDNALLDNVSEESVELELPPPMCELQALPSVTPATAAHPDGAVAPTVDKVPGEAAPSNGPGKPEAEEEDLPNRALSTLNVSTIGVGELQAVNSELNLSRIVDLAASDDDTTAMSSGSICPPVLTGVPSDLPQLQILGRVRLHGALAVASQLVGTHTASLDTSLTELALSPGPPAPGSPTPSARLQDEELLKAIVEDSTSLCFVNRHLVLFERGLVVADAAIEHKGKLCCQFRHFVPLCQIAILEDISVGGSRPSEEKVLWFCVSERPRRSAAGVGSSGMPPSASALQSHLCHVLAPQSPETRLHWLSELNAALENSRRQSSITAPKGLVEVTNLGV